MSERIKETTLPADFLDGEILYGADVNKIITVLRSAVNFNKYDIDKMYIGQMTDYVFVYYDDMIETTTAEDAQYAIVLRGNTGGVAEGDEDTVVLYQWNLATETWDYIDDMVGIVEMWQGYKAYENRMATAESDIAAIETNIDNIEAGTQDITYNNSTSGMTATTVKGAIDELDNEIDKVKVGTTVVAKATGDKDGNQIDTTYLKKVGGIMSGNIAMGSKKITGLANGTENNDAVNKAQMEAKIAADIATHNTNENAHTDLFNAKADLVGGKVPASQVPNAYDDFAEYATYALLEAEETKSTAVLYIVTADETSGNNTSTYRWTGSTFIKIHDQLSASEVKTLYESNANTNAYTDAEKAHLTALPADAYSKTELDGGQLDNRYYTETEIGDGTVPIVKAATHVDTPKVVFDTTAYMEYDTVNQRLKVVITE